MRLNVSGHVLHALVLRVDFSGASSNRAPDEHEEVQISKRESMPSATLMERNQKGGAQTMYMRFAAVLTGMERARRVALQGAAA